MVGNTKDKEQRPITSDYNSLIGLCSLSASSRLFSSSRFRLVFVSFSSFFRDLPLTNPQKILHLPRPIGVSRFPQHLQGRNPQQGVLSYPARCRSRELWDSFGEVPFVLVSDICFAAKTCPDLSGGRSFCDSSQKKAKTLSFPVRCTLSRLSE